MILFILLVFLLFIFLVDSVSDFGFFFGGKMKGGEIGLDGNGILMMFFYYYSEKVFFVGK